MTFELHLRHVQVEDHGGATCLEGWIDSRADLDGKVRIVCDDGERGSFAGWDAIVEDWSA